MSDVYKQELKPIDVLTDITCNMCGNSCRNPETGNFECACLQVTWGFGTPWDGERHRAHICVPCYTELTARPLQENAMGRPRYVLTPDVDNKFYV